MSLVLEHTETDTRTRILLVAERLFREIGYQKTTVADIAKVLKMSPANVYRFFDSKAAIHQGVALRIAVEERGAGVDFEGAEAQEEFLRRGLVRVWGHALRSFISVPSRKGSRPRIPGP